MIDKMIKMMMIKMVNVLTINNGLIQKRVADD